MSHTDPRLVARIGAAVAALPSTEQQVFVLHAAQGMDYPAIAGRLGLTVSEVEELLAAALIRLVRDLGPGGR